MWWRKQRDCQHLHARGIYGDAIMANGWKRGYCPDCGHWMHQLPARAAVRTEPERLEDVNLADSQQWDTTKRYRYAETPDSSLPRFPEPVSEPEQ